MEHDEIKAALLKLTDGLIYISESDYEIDVLDWSGEDEEGILEKISAVSNTGKADIEEQSAGTFFSRTIKALDPADEFAAGIARQYKELQSYLEQTFSSVTVFRTGKIQVHIFIVCKKNAGPCFALHTISVET